MVRNGAPQPFPSGSGVVSACLSAGAGDLASGNELGAVIMAPGKALGLKLCPAGGCHPARRGWLLPLPGAAGLRRVGAAWFHPRGLVGLDLSWPGKAQFLGRVLGTGLTLRCTSFSDRAEHGNPRNLPLPQKLGRGRQAMGSAWRQASSWPGETRKFLWEHFSTGSVAGARGRLCLA